MASIISLLLVFSERIGYWGIVLLMAIESSFIPFPSEVVIPPAAYLAQQGKMNIFLVILSGILGSLIGAVFNYFIAITLGRKMIYALAGHKYAKYFLINEKQIAKVEEYFLKYGNMSTFIGRLVPAIRQLISLPAGFCRMKIKNFVFYTLLGSSLWIIILALLGYVFGANEEVLSKYYEEISIIFVLLGVGFVIFSIIKNKKNKKDGSVIS